MIIPDYVVNQVNELPIEDVAEKLGISIRSHKALCFMHDDHTPSLKFTPTKNIFFCFVCDKGGGPIQLVMDKFRDQLVVDANLFQQLQNEKIANALFQSGEMEGWGQATDYSAFDRQSRKWWCKVT